MALTLYIAKDDFGLHFFKDFPDIIKFSEDYYEFTGYPVDFGDLKMLKDMIAARKEVKSMIPYKNISKVEFGSSNIRIESVI